MSTTAFQPEQNGVSSNVRCLHPGLLQIEMTIVDYPDDVKSITFQHGGKDTQFWKDYYGMKMTGAVVRFEFDFRGRLQAASS